MTSNVRRLVCSKVCFLVLAIGGLPHAASALETPNSILGLGVDGMTLTHFGLFRNPTAGLPADGFNTFQFGTFAINNPLTTGTAYGNELDYGRYTSFRFSKTGEGDCCISHNGRIHIDSPEHWDGSAFAPAYPLDITNDYFPVIDRAGFGQLFDPAEYQVEVKFKPLIQEAFPNGPNIPPALTNTSTLFTVGMDRHGGFVWNEETGEYKRAAEGIAYNIGSPLDADTGLPVDPDLAINTWYLSAEKDADGYATWTVPVTENAFAGKSFYWGFAQDPALLEESLANGGRVFDEDTQTWGDATTAFGPESQLFGGPEDPNRPGSKLNTPNGTPLMSFGAPAGTTGLFVEIKYIGLTKINPGPIAARLDANSGITFRFGSGFTYGADQPPIDVPGDPFGLGYLPPATDQISRFDENGMTNLILNMRTPDDPNETHRFLLRGAPGPTGFDGTEATVNVRAKLLAGNTAQNLQIVAKDLDGNDTAGNPFGADEYNYELDLSQFNSDTFTTISIPLSMFTLAAFTAPVTVGGLDSVGPFGFNNAGDGEMSDFNLYEFGGRLAPNSGLLKLELEYMEIRLPDTGIAGDYNGNGVVDAADYTFWRDRLGQNIALPNTNPDDTDNMVTTAEYDFWKSRFGATSGSGSSALAATESVPEPGTMALIALAGSFLAIRRRR